MKKIIAALLMIMSMNAMALSDNELQDNAKGLAGTYFCAGFFQESVPYKYELLEKRARQYSNVLRSILTDEQVSMSVIYMRNAGNALANESYSTLNNFCNRTYNRLK